MDSQLNSKLDSLIKNAITNIPFYKEYFRGKQPVLDDFPILKKDFIRDNFNKFKSENTLEKVNRRLVRISGSHKSRHFHNFFCDINISWAVLRHLNGRPVEPVVTSTR